MKRASFSRVGLLALLGGVVASCAPKAAKELTSASEAIGQVLAEETVKLAGPKKQIAIITYDANWGPVSTAEESFKKTLKKRGYAAVAAKSANLGDPMRSGDVGLKAADFLEVLHNFPEAGAVVSFAGAPLLKDGDRSSVAAEHPPVLVVATAMMGTVPGVTTDRMKLANLVDEKIIQLAIIDGSDARPQKPGKTDATHEMFSQHYRILQRPD